MLGSLRRLVGRAVGGRAEEHADSAVHGSAPAGVRPPDGGADVRIDAARDRLRSTIPPISEEDELED